MRFALVFLCLSSFALCEESSIPSSLSEDSASKDMVWNKWETDSFMILSINFGFGSKLRDEAERIKSDFQVRWSLPDKPFPVKCKIVCVPDPSSLKKFFSIDFPRIEFRTNETAIWIDESRSSELPCLVSSACLRDSPKFVRVGLSKLLCLNPDEISTLLLSSPDSVGADDDSPGGSALLCVFLKNEFGSKNFARIILGEEPHDVCGFPDKQSFSSTLTRYSYNLKSDLRSGKTPSSYLKP